MLARSKRSDSPPRAVLAFRVGIVGHRPNRLPPDKERLEALRGMLRTVLQEVKREIEHFGPGSSAAGLFSNERPILRAVSPLAEGSDRIFGAEAIDLGYHLVCPMPFAQEDFEHDFLPPKALETDSLERFRTLLERAGAGAGVTKFELDGKRSASDLAYGAAGRVVLNQSDLMIAVWDGSDPAGGGGTVETLQEALHYRVPVLWIDALAPLNWQLLREPDDFKRSKGEDRHIPRGAHTTGALEAQAAIAETVRRIVREEVGLPSELAAGAKGTARPQKLQYFQERKPRLNLGFVWKAFRDTFGSGRVRLPAIRVLDFEMQIRKEWPTREDATGSPKDPAKPALPSDLEDWVNAHLRSHYAWSDKRGDLYADAYRSTYVTTYFASALAVFFAVWPVAFHVGEDGQLVSGTIELFLVLLVLFLFVFGRARRWHERWMEYRLLAELIRQLRLLIPLGGGRPFPHLPRHLGYYGNVTQTWMYWHMRAIARATSLPHARVTREYARQCLDYVANVIGGQLKFHQQNEVRSSNIAHRLHVASTALFVLTIISIAMHLPLHRPELLTPLHLGFLADHREALSACFVVAATSLPAFAAAFAAISNQGEFTRLAKRSAAMAESFERFAREVATLRMHDEQHRDGLRLNEVVPLARNIAAVMIDEVADWRVVFIDRPPTT